MKALSRTSIKSVAATRPFVSVVIPVYNEKDFIAPCLDALTGQSIPADRIYVINNNSTDESIHIASRYAGVTIINETLQGICAASKTGYDVAAANGGIILRCDADSRPSSDWIEKIIQTFNDTPTIVAITGPGAVYDTGRIQKWLVHQLYMKPYFFLVGLALGRVPLFGSNLALRATTWTAVAQSTHLSQHQNIHDDIDLSYHIREKGDTYYDKTLVMPISARPFRAISKLPSRYAAGFRSIFIHWPKYAPWNIDRQ